MKCIIVTIKRCLQEIVTAFIEFWEMLSKFIKEHKKPVLWHIVALIIIAVIYTILYFALPLFIFFNYLAALPFAIIGYIVFMIRKHLISEPKPGDKSYYYDIPLKRKPFLFFIVWAFAIAFIPILIGTMELIKYITV